MWVRANALVPALVFVALISAQSAKAETTVERIVTFGTSLTARGGWQKPLEERLTACLERPVSVLTVAKSGETTQWALASVQEVVGLKPDVVVIEFYANDAAVNRFMTTGRSRRNFADLLAALKQQLPQTRLIVQTMNPMFGLRGMIRPFLSSYIAAHREEAERQGAETIDYTPGWAAFSPAELERAIPDGGHPLPHVASGIIVPRLARQIAGRDCGN